MNPQRSRNIWRWLVGFFIGACVISIGILTAAGWMGKQIEEARSTLQQYGDALVAGNFEKAYTLRDLELKRVLSESEFRTTHELAESRNGKLEKVVLEPTQKVSDQHGMVILINSRLVYEHAEDRFVVTMKKEGDGWFVHDAKYSGR